MNSYFVILRYEIFLLFISPSTYVSSFYFLSLIGVGFRYFIESFIHTDWILAPLSSITLGLFFGSPALVPFLTMRSLAEEKKLGTLETLNTAPINFISLVIGKWTACFLFFTSITLLCFSYPLLFTLLFPTQAINLGFDQIESWAGNLFFILSYGATFTAIGIFSSSLTKNQMVAGMLTFTKLTVLIFIMVFNFKTSSSTYYSSNIQDIIYRCFEFLNNGLTSIENFSLGIIKIKTILYQINLTLFFLMLSVLQIERVNR